jgi:uncharacterized protein
VKILIDIGHPAHVHLFKYFAWEMQKNNHLIYFTCREKEFEKELLEHYGFKYKSFGRKYATSLGKLLGLVEFDIKEFIEGIKFQPDVFLSHGSMYAAHAAWLLGKPHIAMEDTGNWEQIRLYLLFTDVVLTPDVLWSELGPKQIKYSGYHELAYLHPNRYAYNGLHGARISNIQEDYALLRFISWKATHDKGQKGFSQEHKNELVRYLTSKMKVIISCEGEIPEVFEKYKYQIRTEQIHDVLTDAKIFIGEGATMASEAGVLGTPSIYVNTIKACNNEDLERYGLVVNIQRSQDVMDIVEEILNINRIKEEWRKRLHKMLKNKIDVTAFLVWFVENYPESFEIMRENPEYQYIFR